MSDGGWQYLPKSPRQDFTVVEAIITISLIAILARIALPFGVDYLRERQAAEVISAVVMVEGAVRQAALAGDTAAVSDAPAGVIPAGLSAYLPDGFSFDHDSFVLNWNLFDGAEVLERVLIGSRHGSINIEIPGEGLRAAVARLAGRRIWLYRDNVLSVLVVDLDRAAAP